MKTVTTSAQFAAVTARVSVVGKSAMTVLKSAGWVYKGTKKLKWPARYKMGLLCGTPLLIPVEIIVFSSDIVTQLILKVPCVVKMSRVLHHYNKLLPDAKIGLRGYEADVGEFLSRTGDEGVSIINTMDTSDLQKIFSLKDLKNNKVTSELMGNLRKNIVKMRSTNAMSTSDVESFNTHIIKVGKVEGLETDGTGILQRMTTARTAGNYNGISHEVRTASQTIDTYGMDSVIAFGRKTDLPSGQRPQEIDVLSKQNNRIIASESKYSYKNWDKGFTEDIGQIEAGFKKMKSQGTINDYEFVFGTVPPEDSLKWLNSRDTPYKLLLKEKPSDDIIACLTKNNVKWEIYP